MKSLFSKAAALLFFLTAKLHVDRLSLWFLASQWMSSSSVVCCDDKQFRHTDLKTYQTSFPLFSGNNPTSKDHITILTLKITEQV